MSQRRGVARALRGAGPRAYVSSRRALRAGWRRRIGIKVTKQLGDGSVLLKRPSLCPKSETVMLFGTKAYTRLYK